MLTKPENLTDKQWAFVCEYPKDWNATQAAIRAGYSRDTAYSIGWENLRKPEIRVALSSYYSAQTMDSEEVFFHLAEMARGLPDKVQEMIASLDVQGIVSSGYGHLIKSYTETQHGGRIEFYDRKGALELIGRGHAAFTDKIKSDGELRIRIQFDEEERP